MLEKVAGQLMASINSVLLTINLTLPKLSVDSTGSLNTIEVFEEGY
jgi:hypothetical protein